MFCSEAQTLLQMCLRESGSSWGRVKGQKSKSSRAMAGAPALSLTGHRGVWAWLGLMACWLWPCKIAGIAFLDFPCLQWKLESRRAGNYIRCGKPPTKRANNTTAQGPGYWFLLQVMIKAGPQPHVAVSQEKRDEGMEESTRSLIKVQTRKRCTSTFTCSTFTCPLIGGEVSSVAGQPSPGWWTDDHLCQSTYSKHLNQSSADHGAELGSKTACPALLEFTI